MRTSPASEHVGLLIMLGLADAHSNRLPLEYQQLLRAHLGQFFLQQALVDLHFETLDRFTEAKFKDPHGGRDVAALGALDESPQHLMHVRSRGELQRLHRFRTPAGIARSAGLKPTLACPVTAHPTKFCSEISVIPVSNFKIRVAADSFNSFDLNLHKPL
jgi:hypothetical protein